MKKWSLVLAIIVLSVYGQSNGHNGVVNVKRLPSPAFKTGEYLKYSLDYGIVSAGYAELSVKKKFKKKGKWVYHMSGFGRTTGVTDWAFRTRDYYDTYISESELKPVEFIRNVDEGGYKINRHILFDHKNEKAIDLKLSKDSSLTILPDAQDLLSSFYYLRCLDASQLKKGDKIQINIYLDHEDFPFQLRYLGKEMVKMKGGKIRCLKFVPVVQDGRVFRDEESITLWVSDDANKVPVYVKSKLRVGSVKMKLTDYSNLKYPLKIQR
jgi:hypothetical protein